MVDPAATTRPLVRNLKRNPHYLAIATIVGVAIVLEAFLASSIVSENRKHFRSDLSGFVQTIKTHVAGAAIEVKDLTARQLSGNEDGLVEEAQASYIYRTGHFYIGGGASSPPLPAAPATLQTDVSFSGFLDRLTARPGTLQTFSAGSFQDFFPGLQRENIVFAQATPLAGEEDWGLRLTTSSSRRYFVAYAIIDMGAAIRNAETNLKHTSIEEIRYELNSGSFSSTTIRRADIIPFFLKGAVETVSIPVGSGTSIEFAVREYDGNMLVHLYFILGFVLLAVISGAFLIGIRRSARNLRRDQARAMREAVEANNVKSEFLATMSHEIRTPLNGILGLAEVLNRSELTPAQKRYTHQIMSSGSMLLGILNDILDMSKLESGKMEISPERINLHAKLLKLATFYYPVARKKQIDLHVHVDHSVPEFADIDPMRIRQVIGNLLANAIKFTAKGEVILSARFEKSDTCPSPANGWLLVEVKDTGIGMEQKEIDKLFQRFVQANSSMSRKFGGTGLGLSISNLIARAMGGNILVRSTRGVGSTFVLRLPIEGSAPVSVSYTGTDRIAVLTSSRTSERLISSAFEPLDLALQTFSYDDNTLDQILDECEANGPFRVVVFDEEHDVQRSVDDWQSLKARFGERISSVIVGDKQLSKNYARFDRAVIKPFLPLQVVETVLELITGEDKHFSEIEPAAASNPLHNAFTGCRMLAIDDNQVNLLVVEELFHDYGFAIDTVNNGQKALSRIAANSYDIVLMDCQMPVMDGYEATRRMRKMMSEGVTARCPIVAITANALKGDREKCLAAGMDDFLAKPMQATAINEMFERLLKDPEFKRRLTPKAGPKRTAEVYRLPAAAPVPVPASKPAKVEVTPRSAQPAAAPPAIDGQERVPLMDLRDFQRTRSSMKKFDALVSFYRTDSRNYLDMLARAIAEGARDEGVLPAHTLKSSSRILGATGLAALAEIMENRLRGQEDIPTAELTALLEKMNAALAATLAQIDLMMTEPVEKAG